MKNPNDLRVIKTQKAIIEAFLQMLAQKPFENISVNDVCECAVVRRATFYNHFTDKYDLFTKALQYIQKGYAAALTQDDRNTFLDTLEVSLDYMEQNEHLFTAIVKSRYAAILMQLFSEQLAVEVRKYLETEDNGIADTKISLDLMTELLTGALMQAAGWWFTQRKSVSKAEVTEQVRRFIQNASMRSL